MCLALRDCEFASALLIVSTIRAGSMCPSSLMPSGRKWMTAQHGWCAVRGFVFGLVTPRVTSGFPLGLYRGPVAGLVLGVPLVGVSVVHMLAFLSLPSSTETHVWVSEVAQFMAWSFSKTAVALYVASCRWSIFSPLFVTFSTSAVTVLFISIID